MSSVHVARQEIGAAIGILMNTYKLATDNAFALLRRVRLILPGLVAAGAGLLANVPPDRLLQPADVAAAVQFVPTFPVRGYPTEIRLQPQRT